MASLSPSQCLHPDTHQTLYYQRKMRNWSNNQELCNFCRSCTLLSWFFNLSYLLLSLTDGRFHAGNVTNYNHILDIPTLITFDRWSPWVLPLLISYEFVVVPAAKSKYVLRLHNFTPNQFQASISDPKLDIECTGAQSALVKHKKNSIISKKNMSVCVPLCVWCSKQTANKMVIYLNAH